MNTKFLLALTLFCLSPLAACVKADVDVTQVVIHHQFLSPNGIPGCSPSLEVSFTCPTQPVTVNLPGIEEKVHFNPPSGVVASAYVDEIDVTSPSGESLDFIQNVLIEIASDTLHDNIVDYTPSVPPGQDLALFPDDVDLIQYFEGSSTGFTIAITGTVPPAEVPLDVTIFINGEISYEKGL